MTYADIVKYFEDRVFDRSEVQKEITTYFNNDDKDDIVDIAIQKAKDIDTRFKSGESLNIQAENWEKALKKEGNVEDIINENRDLPIGELQKLSGLTQQQETRVANRIEEVARENISTLSRDEFTSLGVINRSLKRVAGNLNISSSDLQSSLEREGFTIANGMIRK